MASRVKTGPAQPQRGDQGPNGRDLVRFIVNQFVGRLSGDRPRTRRIHAPPCGRRRRRNLPQVLPSMALIRDGPAVRMTPERPDRDLARCRAPTCRPTRAAAGKTALGRASRRSNQRVDLPVRPRSTQDRDDWVQDHADQAIHLPFGRRRCGIVAKQETGSIGHHRAISESGCSLWIQSKRVSKTRKSISQTTATSPPPTALSSPGPRCDLVLKINLAGSRPRDLFP
jgi:hypothetical protein